MQVAWEKFPPVRRPRGNRIGRRAGGRRGASFRRHHHPPTAPMIVDALANAGRYRPLHPRLAAAFDYLAAFDPAKPDGKYPIDGDAVYALVQSYATRPAAEKKWESHRRYLDVQYVVSGRERITVAPIGALAGHRATEQRQIHRIAADARPQPRRGALLGKDAETARDLP